MSAVSHPLKCATVADYLAADDASPKKHEFRDGVICAMGGATDDHGRISGNLFGAVHAHMPSHCDVFQGDMRLKHRVERVEAYYYPDLLVTWSDLDRAKMHREHPTLFVEVLSPSSERIDRGEKFITYTAIPSPLEYVIVAQSVPQIDIFRRRDAWRGESYFLNDTITLESLALSLPVAQVYRRVSFGQPIIDPRAIG